MTDGIDPRTAGLAVRLDSGAVDLASTTPPQHPMERPRHRFVPAVDQDGDEDD